MLTLLVAWRWREGKPAPASQRSETEKPIVPSFSTLATLVSSRRFPTQTTTVQQMAVQPHPLRACSLVVWQCIAFATSFLLASQTTSVAATASCMTTSYTTTKLSHQNRKKFPIHQITLEGPSGSKPLHERGGRRAPHMMCYARRPQEGGRVGCTSGAPAGVVPEVAITPGTATRPVARGGDAPRAARPQGQPEVPPPRDFFWKNRTKNGKITNTTGKS